MKLKKELEEMFCVIKKKIEDRCAKDIIMFWIDAVSYEQLSWMPFVYSKKDSSYFFENARTITPYTRPTMHAILQGVLRIEDYDLTQNEIDETNSEVIQDLQNAGYKFLYIGYLDSSNIPNKFKMKINTQVTCKKAYEVSACKVYWELLCNLLRISTPLYCIVHSVAETHKPYMSLALYQRQFRKLSDIFEQGQNKKSYKYLDEQLEFYSGLLSDNITKIYMSDHGDVNKWNFWDFTEHRIHPFFLIEGKKIPAKKVKEMFSYVNFKYIIKYLLKGDENNISKSIEDYAIIEDVDKYSSKLGLSDILHNNYLYFLCSIFGNYQT